MDQLEYHDILYNNDPIGPYPTHLLKRVEKPTNRVPGPIRRVDQRDSVFARSLLGEYGEELQRDCSRGVVCAQHGVVRGMGVVGKEVELSPITGPSDGECRFGCGCAVANDHEIQGSPAHLQWPKRSQSGGTSSRGYRNVTPAAAMKPRVVSSGSVSSVNLLLDRSTRGIFPV